MLMIWHPYCTHISLICNGHAFLSFIDLLLYHSCTGMDGWIINQLIDYLSIVQLHKLHIIKITCPPTHHYPSTTTPPTLVILWPGPFKAQSSVHQSIHSFIHPSIHSSIHPSIHPSHPIQSPSYFSILDSSFSSFFLLPTIWLSLSTTTCLHIDRHSFAITHLHPYLPELTSSHIVQYAVWTWRFKNHPKEIGPIVCYMWLFLICVEDLCHKTIYPSFYHMDQIMRRKCSRGRVALEAQWGKWCIRFDAAITTSIDLSSKMGFPKEWNDC